MQNDMQNDLQSEQPVTIRVRKRTVIGPVIAAGLAVAIACAGVYVIGGFSRNAAAQANCQPAVDLAKKIAPLAKGEVAALTMATSPKLMPDLAFNDADGKPKKLSDFRGHTVLLNLWATWCVPCRKEMPALNDLEKKLSSAKFGVVAVNIDTRDPDKPKAFLKDGNLTNLTYYHDNQAKVFQDLKSAGLALGMPTSVLVDGAGCEIANIAGPAEWASDDAITLLKAASGT